MCVFLCYVCFLPNTFLKNLSTFLAKWMVSTVSLSLRMKSSPVQDGNQNKERVNDRVWSHKSLIRNLRLTHRIGHKFTKAREFIGLHPEGPWLGKGGGVGVSQGGCLSYLISILNPLQNAAARPNWRLAPSCNYLVSSKVFMSVCANKCI